MRITMTFVWLGAQGAARFNLRFENSMGIAVDMTIDSIESIAAGRISSVHFNGDFVA